MSKLHTILVFAQNKRGVLERITMLIRRKMYNLETITASDTEQEGIKRITITFSQGDADKIPQIIVQIKKIVEVVSVKWVDDFQTIEREIALIKIKRPQNLSEITSLVDIFRGSVVSVSPESVVLQISGERKKTLSFIQALNQFEILEIGSSGIVAMER
jgi:acetolactate synthase I/III small subunit